VAVIDQFDHKHLDKDVDCFTNVVRFAHYHKYYGYKRF